MLVHFRVVILKMITLIARDFLWEPFPGPKRGFKMEHQSEWILWDAVQEGEQHFQHLLGSIALV